MILQDSSWYFSCVCVGYILWVAFWRGARKDAIIRWFEQEAGNQYDLISFAFLPLLQSGFAKVTTHKCFKYFSLHFYFSFLDLGCDHLYVWKVYHLSLVELQCTAVRLQSTCSIFLKYSFPSQNMLKILNDFHFYYQLLMGWCKNMGMS